MVATDRFSCLPQNVTVTLSGPIPFAGAVLTSYQFTDRPGANLYTSTGVATAYNCSTQTGSLHSVPAGTWTVRACCTAAARGAEALTHPGLHFTQNTIAYAGAPISSLTATFLLANYAESTTLKWFVQPALTTPTVWYG